MAKKTPPPRIRCNGCNSYTKHTTLYSRETDSEDYIDEVGELSFRESIELLECNGCEAVTLRISSYCFDLDETVSDYYYPPRVSRRLPKWKSKLPPDLSSLLHETYVALHADSLRLAVMGARAILDMVLSDTVGDIGGFQRKLSELESKGFIGTKNREYLNAALDVGSAAMHRGYAPCAEEAGQVLDILENLLEAVYVLNPVASKLKERTPPRPQQKKV